MEREGIFTSSDTDKQWERLGELDPFWAVLSNPEYHRENLTDAQIGAFLDTGEEYVAWLWSRCRELFGEPFAPTRVLDFGCGVGRVTLPLSRRASGVVAADVADSMLQLARDILERH